MTTYRIEGEDLTRGQIVARLPHINQRTIGARLLRGYRTWAEIGADKATTLRRSKARFAGWQIQPKKNTAAARIEIEHLRARVALLEPVAAAARIYYRHYMQDEADDGGEQWCGHDQHERAKAVRDSLHDLEPFTVKELRL